MTVNETTRIWMLEQLDYLKKLSRKDRIVLKIYSETYLFKLLNQFCNQIIDPKDIFEYKIEEKHVKEYIKIKGITIIENTKSIEYFTFVIDLIISIAKDLISIIMNAPPTPTLLVYRGIKTYYYSKEDNVLLNFG